MARIATGIKGIRKTIATDKAGWHVYLDDKAMGFDDRHMSAIMRDMVGKTLVWVGGNILTFETR